jgi:hypothetical protein
VAGLFAFSGSTAAVGAIFRGNARDRSIAGSERVARLAAGQFSLGELALHGQAAQQRVQRAAGHA